MLCFACHTETTNLIHVLAITQRDDTQFSYDICKEYICPNCASQTNLGNAIVKCITCGEVYTVRKEFILGRLEANEFVRKISLSDILTLRTMPGCPFCLR